MRLPPGLGARLQPALLACLLLAAALTPARRQIRMALFAAAPPAEPASIVPPGSVSFSDLRALVLASSSGGIEAKADAARRAALGSCASPHLSPELHTALAAYAARHRVVRAQLEATGTTPHGTLVYKCRHGYGGLGDQLKGLAVATAAVLASHRFRALFVDCDALQPLHTVWAPCKPFPDSEPLIDWRWSRHWAPARALELVEGGWALDEGTRPEPDADHITDLLISSHEAAEELGMPPVTGRRGRTRWPAFAQRVTQKDWPARGELVVASLLRSRAQHVVFTSNLLLPEDFGAAGGAWGGASDSSRREEPDSWCSDKRGPGPVGSDAALRGAASGSSVAARCPTAPPPELVALSGPPAASRWLFSLLDVLFSPSSLLQARLAALLLPPPAGAAEAQHDADALLPLQLLPLPSSDAAATPCSLLLPPGSPPSVPHCIRHNATHGGFFTALRHGLASPQSVVISLHLRLGHYEGAAFDDPVRDTPAALPAAAACAVALGESLKASLGRSRVVWFISADSVAARTALHAAAAQAGIVSYDAGSRAIIHTDRSTSASQDDFTSTFVDHALLSMAHGMVKSSSGFSMTAAAWGGVGAVKQLARDSAGAYTCVDAGGEHLSWRV